MSKPKPPELSRERAVQQPTPPVQDEMDEDSDIELRLDASDSELEKDETELELERAVFGDSAGFRQGLKDFNVDDTFQGEEQLARGHTGLEALDDAQLFFTDTGDSSLGPVATTGAESEDENVGSNYPAAWEDSDDERMFISLASVPRLRKLRRTEAEDVVNGKEYSKRLRRQFETLNGVPEWATHALQSPVSKRAPRLGSDGEGSDEEGEMDDDVRSVAPLSELLQNAEALVRKAGPGSGKKRKLRAEVVDIQRTKDIAGVQPSAITSLSFHSQLPLLLSSGPSSTLYLHHIASSPPAPTPNPLLTSMHVSGTQLNTTAFHPTDGRIFLSARRRYFHVWDLNTGRVEKITRIYGHQHEQRTMEHFKLSPCGRYLALLGSARKGGGIINILSTATLQWSTQVRIESRNGVADFCWWRNGKGLTVIGKNGEVTEWNVDEQRIVARWQDEGAVGTTTLSLGGQHEYVKSPIGTDRWIAIGSSSGIVNIYDRREWLASPPPSSGAVLDQPMSKQPKPTKVLDHLTTPTSHLAFSQDGQLLAVASRWKRDAMRLVHLPSCTVFKNWPTSSTPLGRITAVAFAGGDVLEGGHVHSLLAVANEQGKIRLWEIR